jgi:hypothetical protein
VVDFYRKVSDQTDMNGGPRIEGYEAMARLQGYPESLRPWVIESAVTLHRLVTKTDRVNWLMECGKPYRLIEAEDVCDGD